MSTAKSERLMNLLIMLLVPTRPVPKARIREAIYPDATPDGFEKMFERDKDELRSLGVPVTVGQIDAYFDDEPGYRIRPDELHLPEVDLTPDEAAVVGLATRVWEHQRLASATAEAVRKLTAAGVDTDSSALDIALPRLTADEPSFDLFLEALLERRQVEFDYWRTGQVAPARRRVQPWGITRYSGRWYLLGFDLDRDDERVFRLSRVQGNAVATGPRGAYEIPEGLDIEVTTRRLAPPPADGRAVVLVRTGAALPLRRAADTVEPGVTGPDGTTSWDRLVITRGAVGLADEVLSHGANAYVEEPDVLAKQVVAALDDVLAEAPR